MFKKNITKIIVDRNTIPSKNFDIFKFDTRRVSFKLNFIIYFYQSRILQIISALEQSLAYFNVKH